MSSTEEDDCMIKLDTNIEVETLVRNKFAEDDDGTEAVDATAAESLIEDPSSLDGSVTSPGNSSTGVSSIAQEPSTSQESQYAASTSSEVSVANLPSAMCDINLESGESMAMDTTTPQEVSSSIEYEAPAVKMHPLKHANAAERIAFCIDMSKDMDNVAFQTKTAQLSALAMVKRVIGFFVQNKHFINKKHEFGIMVMYETAHWVFDFTDNPKRFVEALNDLTETIECSSCDVSSIIALITEKYPSIFTTRLSEIEYIYRVIFIYGRANCRLYMSDPSIKTVISQAPSLYLDVLFIHAPGGSTISASNEIVYNFFLGLDTSDKSYILEMPRSVSNIHCYMGKLLCHPFQRASQQHAHYHLADYIPADP